MGKTGDKGKGIAESSSQNPKGRGKKRRVVEEHSEEEEDHTMEEEGTHVAEDPEADVMYVRPDWTEGVLSRHHSRWQPKLFRLKMAKNINKKDGFLCEKAVPDKYFAEFGVINQFKTLGWEAALKCYDGGDSKLYMNEIEEWVSTLRKQEGNRAADISLIGTVNGIEISLSFDTMRQIAKFDSKSINRYKYPSLNDLYFEPERHPTWNMMLETLFVPGRNMDRLLRENLQIKAKLLLMIVQQNVIPRRGDKELVRFPEIPILYALMTGGPLVSYRYIVINNIWLSRDSLTRRFIPHCRLITALLKMYGAIDENSVGVYKRHPPFDLKNLGPNLEFKESDRHLKLKNQGVRWWELKNDARPLRAGEVDEPVSEEERESSDEENADAHIGVSEVQQHGGPSRSRRADEGRARTHDYASHQYEPNWAYEGSMRDVMIGARPGAFYQWPESAQVLFDHSTRMGASNERAIKRMEDRQEVWNRTHAYNFQQEINHRYEDDRNRRMHDQWHSGQLVTPDPPIIDYQTLPPYDGSTTYPTPPIHHSMWVDPNQQQPQQPGSSEEGTFGLNSILDTMNSLFGPPGPRYY